MAPPRQAVSPAAPTFDAGLDAADGSPAPPLPSPMTAGNEAALVAAVAAAVVVWLLSLTLWRTIGRVRRRRCPPPLTATVVRRRSVRYGLLTPSAAYSDDDESVWSGGWDASAPASGDATSRALAALTRSPAYTAHLKARGLTAERAGVVQRRLELYKELRTVDPATFRGLVASPPASVDARPPSALLSVVDLTAGPAGAGAAALALLLLPGAPIQVRDAGRAAAAVAAWWLACAAVGGRSPLPGCGLVWEDAAWATPAPAWRLLAAAGVDVVYGAGTLGLGFLVSARLRLGAGGQSLGERAAGVRLVREVVEPVSVG